MQAGPLPDVAGVPYSVDAVWTSLSTHLVLIYVQSPIAITISSYVREQSVI